MASVQAMTYFVEGSEGDDYGASFDLTGKLDLFPDGIVGGHLPCPMMFPFSSDVDEGEVRIVSVISRGEWTDLTATFQLTCTTAGDTFKANARTFFYEGAWRLGAVGVFGGKPGLEMHGQWQKDAPPSNTGGDATANMRGKFTFKLKPSKDPLPPPPVLIWYQVHVITGHDADAGAAADVALQLHASHSPDRPSSWMPLHKTDCISKNEKMFKRNQIDSFRVCTNWDEQLISQCSVSVKTSPDGAEASWQLARVEVMHEASQLWSVFACSDWLPKKSDGSGSGVEHLARSCAPSGANELLDASQAALRKMQETHNVLQSDHSQLTTQLEEAIHDRDAARRELQDQSDKLVLLRDSNSELERAVEAAKQEALQAREAMDTLRLARQEVDRKHVLLGKEHAEMSRLLSAAREETLTNQKQHQLNKMNLETRLMEAEKECSLLEDMAGLTEANAVQAAKLRELQAECARLNTDVADNERMHQSASTALEASTLKLEEVRQLCASTATDIETSNAEWDRLERSREELHARVSEAVGGLAALSQRHERARDHARTLQEIDHKMLTQRNRISALEEQSALGQTREQQLQDRLHELKIANAELEGQLRTHESAHRTLVSQTAASESESTRLTSELKKWDIILMNQQERISQAMAKTRVLEEHLVQQHLKMQALGNSNNSQKPKSSLKHRLPTTLSLQAAEVGGKIPELTQFSGGRGESVEHWLSEVAAAERGDCTDPELVQRAAAALRGRALTWWCALSKRPATWEELCTALCAAFGKSAAGDDLVRNKLKALTQAECVPATVEAYVAAFVALAKRMGREAMSQADWVQTFIRGISDDVVRKGVQFCSPATLEDAARCAERVLSDRRRHGERPASSSGAWPRMSSLPSSSADYAGGNAAEESKGRSARPSKDASVVGSTSAHANRLSSGADRAASRRTVSAYGGRASARSSAVSVEFTSASRADTRDGAPAPTREARALGHAQDGAARRRSQDSTDVHLAGSVQPSVYRKSGKQHTPLCVRSMSGGVNTRHSRLPQQLKAGEGSNPQEVVCFMCGGVNSHPSGACPALNRVLANAQQAADARPKSAARFGSLAASSYNRNTHYAQR